MANNEVNIKLTVDGKEATATLNLTDEKLAELIRKAQKAGDTGTTSLAKIGQIVTGVNQGLELAGKAYSVLSKPIEAAGQFEKYEAQLKTMLGSTEKAQERLSELVEFAKSTPFELPEVVSAGNQLQALGRYSQDNLRMLGDLASASGKPMDQALAAFAKMASGQKGIAVDMFRDLLITQQDWMDATGKGITKNGELLATTEEMISALPEILQKKNFTGMMEEQSKTFEGQLSNFKDSVGQFEAELGKVFLPVAKNVLGVLTPAMSGAKNNIQLLITVFEAGTAAFVTYQLAVNGATIVTKVFEAASINAKRAIDAIKLAFASNPLGLIITGVVALSVALYSLNEAYGNTLENQLKSAKAAEDLNKKEISETESKIKSIAATSDLAAEYAALSEKLNSGKLSTEETEKAQKRLKEISQQLKEHTRDLKDEYEELNTKLLSGRLTAEERAKTEKRMKDILGELKKDYPDIITSTTNYSGSLQEVRKAAGDSATAIEKLSERLGELQKKQVSLSIATKQIETSSAFEELRDQFTVLGMSASEEDLPIVKQIDAIGEKIKNGKLSEAAKELEDFYGKYASWAEKSTGSNKQFNIDVAGAASALKGQVEAMRRLYELQSSGGVMPKVQANDNLNKPPVITQETVKTSTKKTADVDIEIDRRMEVENKRLRNMEVEELEKEKVALEEKYIRLSSSLAKNEGDKKLQIETGVAKESLNVVKKEIDDKLKEQERFESEKKKYAEKQAAEAEVKQYKEDVINVEDLQSEKALQQTNAETIQTRIVNAVPGSEDAENLDSLKLQQETAQQKIDIINAEIDARNNLQAKKDEIFLQDQARAEEERLQNEIQYMSAVELNDSLALEQQRMFDIEAQIRASKDAKDLENLAKDKQNTERKIALIKSEQEARRQAAQQMVESAVMSYNAQESFGRQLGNSIRQEVKAYAAKAVAAAVAGQIAANPLLALITAPAIGYAVSAIFEAIIPKFEAGQVDIPGKSHKDGGKLVEIEGGESIINKTATAKNKSVLQQMNEGKTFRLAGANKPISGPIFDIASARPSKNYQGLSNDVTSVVAKVSGSIARPASFFTGISAEGAVNRVLSASVVKPAQRTANSVRIGVPNQRIFDSSTNIRNMETIRDAIILRDNARPVVVSSGNDRGFRELGNTMTSSLRELGDRMVKIERQVTLDPYGFRENMDRFQLVQEHIGS